MPQLPQALDDFCRHPECLGGYQHHAYSIKQAEHFAQGVDSAPVAKITDKRDAQPIQISGGGLQLFLDGIQIEQGLARVLIGAIPAVDHGNPAGSGKFRHRTHLGMTHHNGVTVAADDTGSIVQRLALGDSRMFKACGFAHVTPQQIEGAAKTDPGAGAGLKKHTAQDRAVEHLGQFLSLGIGFHAISDCKHLKDILSFKLPDTEDMSAGKFHTVLPAVSC